MASDFEFILSLITICFILSYFAIRSVELKSVFFSYPNVKCILIVKTFFIEYVIFKKNYLCIFCKLSFIYVNKKWNIFTYASVSNMLTTTCFTLNLAHGYFVERNWFVVVILIQFFYSFLRFYYNMVIVLSYRLHYSSIFSLSFPRLNDFQSVMKSLS